MKSTKIAVAITLGGMLVAWALYTSLGGAFAWPWSATHGDPSLVRPVSTEDHIFGNPAAPVMIVVYCDFTSPYCRGFSTTMQELIGNDGATGQIGWVAREFPLKEDGESSALPAARAAECVAKVAGNDAFWKFANLLYEHQPVDPSQFGDLALQAGVTDDGFAACYADAASEVDARIKADRANGLQAGATGTPYSLLLAKGRAPIVLDGAYPYDELRAVVDRALGQ